MFFDPNTGIFLVSAPQKARAGQQQELRAEWNEENAKKGLIGKAVCFIASNVTLPRDPCNGLDESSEETEEETKRDRTYFSRVPTLKDNTPPGSHFHCFREKKPMK